MTVVELIEKLQGYQGNWEVRVEVDPSIQLHEPITDVVVTSEETILLV